MDEAKLKGILEKFIFKNHSERLMKYGVCAIAVKMYGKVIEEIRSGKCPFCGKQLTIGGVKVHLRRGRTRCSVKFDEMVESVIRIYKDVKSRMVKTGKRGYNLYLSDWEKVKVSGIAEAVDKYFEYMGERKWLP